VARHSSYSASFTMAPKPAMAHPAGAHQSLQHQSLQHQSLQQTMLLLLSLLLPCLDRPVLVALCHSPAANTAATTNIIRAIGGAYAIVTDVTGTHNH
jgi:hypothetical protein